MKYRFKYRNYKRYDLYISLVVAILGIGLGFALLSTNLDIQGSTIINNANWDIHFEHVQETTGGVTPNSTTVINAAGDTVTYNVTLDTPGQFYEFTIDAVNDGSINGMIDSVTSTLNGGSINNLPDCVTYSVTYSDGMPIAANQLLVAGTSETYKVRVEFKRDIEVGDLPTSNQTLTLTFSVNYVQATNAAVSVAHPVSFATDSWETIIAAVQSGSTSAYQVGDTKTVELGNSLGTHTLRIANKSTPAECSTPGFSQTACGFVLEFADIITTHNMNPSGTYQGTTYNYGWNVDGWPVSAMRTYLNDTNAASSIINSLPSVIKNAIIDTTVVSGHGSKVGETNFTSIDKLYLLSTHEIWEDVDGNTNSGIDNLDTSYNNTRRLDYYAGLNVTTSSYSGAIKKRNGSNGWWWMRSAYSINTTYFFIVNTSGGWSNYSDAGNTNGVSPAFRLG